MSLFILKKKPLHDKGFLNMAEGQGRIADHLSTLDPLCHLRLRGIIRQQRRKHLPENHLFSDHAV